MYKVEWTRKARKSLDKIDQVMKKKIIRKVEKYLAEDPYKRGKRLKGETKKEQWRLRLDDYRVIYKILQEKVIILVLDVGHRKEIY